MIVQADELGTDLPQVIVAMITSKAFRARHSSRVLVKLESSQGKNSGLLTDSVVMTDNLATITDIAIDRVIGKLPMKTIDKALKHTLGL